MTAHKPTGLANADALIAFAERRGLKVEVKTIDEPPDGLMSGYRTVAVTIASPCPERFKGTYLYTAAEHETLIVFFFKRDAKGARAKWTSAFRYRMYPGRVRNIKTLRRVFWEISSMADDTERWNQRAAKEEQTP